MNESLVKDIELLRTQLARAEEVRAKQQVQLVDAHKHLQAA